MILFKSGEARHFIATDKQVTYVVDNRVIFND